MKLNTPGVSFITTGQRKKSCNKSGQRSRQIIPSTEERIINYKLKNIRQQVRNNTKSHQGFGYTYKPLQFNLNK
jgi:hypothetical protein